MRSTNVAENGRKCDYMLPKLVICHSVEDFRTRITKESDPYTLNRRQRQFITPKTISKRIHIQQQRCTNYFIAI